MMNPPGRNLPLPPHLMQAQGMPMPPASPIPQNAQMNPPLNSQQFADRHLPQRPTQLPQSPDQLVDGLSDEDLLALQTAIIEEYREKHPDLNEFELYIAAEVNNLLEEAKENGIFIPPKDAIEFGISQFRKKLNKAVSQERKKLTATEVVNSVPENLPQAIKANAVPQAKEVNRMALNMDLNSSPTSVAKLSSEDIWNMPREQFLALDRKIRQQHYR